MVSWITQWLERSKHGPDLDHQCPTLATSCSPAAELVVGLPQAFPPELTRILASDAAHPSATGAGSEAGLSFGPFDHGPIAPVCVCGGNSLVNLPCNPERRVNPALVTIDAMRRTEGSLEQ